METKQLYQGKEINGFGPNLHLLDLYFPFNIICKCERDGKEYEFDIEVRDMNGRPDCRIGNYYLNAWIRTPASQNVHWHGYSSYQKLVQAVETVMRNKKFTPIGWVKRRQNE